MSGFRMRRGRDGVGGLLDNGQRQRSPRASGQSREARWPHGRGWHNGFSGSFLPCGERRQRDKRCNVSIEAMKLLETRRGGERG
jgi:hypothetical protein